jgi:chromosome partitioning protein
MMYNKWRFTKHQPYLHGRKILESHGMRGIRTIAVINQKGGTGRTTTCVNLAATLGEQSRNVLLIDIDPQHSSTTWYLPAGAGQGTYELLVNPQTPIDALIAPTRTPCVSLIPSAKMMNSVERFLATETGAEQILKVHLKQLKPGRFDQVLIDCPPSLNPLTVDALNTASEVLVPVETHVLGLHGLDKLQQTVAVIRERLSPALRVSGIVACRVKHHTRHAREVIDDIRKHYPDTFFRTVIPENVRLTECPSQGMPITAYAHDSSGAEDYRAPAKEVIAQESTKTKRHAQAQA